MQIPKHDPANRRKRVGPVLLPAEGRKGPAPMWPLQTKVTAEELAHWSRLWSKPQAVMWEQQDLSEMVARYCRMAVEASKPDATAALHSQVTMMEDRLGLSPRAMRMLLWQIAPDEVAEKRDEQAVPVRARLRAVETG